jgi:transposase-like protein
MPDTKERTVEGIRIESDFPDRFDSPDPGDVIEAIFEAGGVLTDAAKRLPCSKKTLYEWRRKYPEINQAATEARQSLVGELRDGMAEVARDHDHKDSYRAKLKLLTMYDNELDWSNRERRVIEDSTSEVQARKRKQTIDSMSDDMSAKELEQEFDALFLNGDDG